MGKTQENFSPARIFGRPTADQIWLGPVQRRALTFLRTPIEGATKLVLGPRGCGKTVLLERYLADLEETLYFRSRDRWESAGALLSALLESADLTSPDGSEVARRNLFSSYLNHQRSLGRKILIAVDDAERLTPAVWQELCRLRAMRCDDGYKPEFLLLGRPHVYGILQSSRSSGWETVRLAVHNLAPPEAADVAAYIRLRLHRAGLPGTLFSEPARALIARLCRGSLKLVNLLCQMSLVVARRQSARVVDEDIVKAARAAICAAKVRDSSPPPAAITAAGITEQGELLVSRAGRLVGRYPLTAHMLLGRSKYNHVCLESPEVSRHHAAIVRGPSGYQIVDLDSDNGLSINGDRSPRRLLSDRDVITLGPYRLELACPQVRSRSERPPAGGRASEDHRPAGTLR